MKTQMKFLTRLTPSFLIVMLFNCMIIDVADAARTAIRGTTVAAARRSPVTSTATTTAATVAEPVVEPEPEADPEIIQNKAAQFDSFLSDASSDDDYSAANLAEQIRRQRAAAEARDNAEYVASNQNAGLRGGKNACDAGLRECMQKTCGSDFSKCALDGDTLFGDKLNKCRRETTCSGEEFKLFTTEIKADRDMNARLSSYTSVIDCGNEYNACIQNECGATFNKCLGKTAADRATKACAKIATKCMEQDSGLAGRVGVVIGRLRENAEIDVKNDETRMYKLRDLMRNQCTKLGAMFDERSFDCVYTVNFFAGENQTTPMASRKLYAGDTFFCNQEWFGVNTTTFKENAYRETRAQTGASSAMLGSGVGTAVGLISSNAIGRALDTQKAKKALDAAEKAKETAGTKENPEGGETKVDKAGILTNGGGKEEDFDKQRTELSKKICQNEGGKWKNNTCECANKNQIWDDSYQTCQDKPVDEELEIQKNNCKSDGTWNEKKNTCECHGTDKIWNKEQAMCVDKTTKKTPLKDAFNRIKTNIQDNVAEKREEKAKQQVRKEKENKEKQQN